jgi:hypothetical protein
LGKLNLQIKEEIDSKFRTEVFKRKGYKKGNLKDAVEEAMILWIDTGQKTVKEDTRKEET